MEPFQGGGKIGAAVSISMAGRIRRGEQLEGVPKVLTR